MNEIQEHNEYTGQVEDIKEDKLKYAAEVGDDLTKSIYNNHKSESLKENGPYSLFIAKKKEGRKSDRPLS